MVVGQSRVAQAAVASHQGRSVDVNTGKLPHVRFDTALVTPERRLTVWREAIDVLFDVAPAEPDAELRPVVLENWLFGPTVLSAGSGPGFRYERSPRAIARDGRDMYMIQVYSAGQCRVLSGAPERMTRPGDVLITDLARPIRTEETAFRNVNLMVPRSTLAPLLRNPDGHGGRLVERERPLAILLGSHLHELVRQAPHLAPPQAVDVIASTVPLIAAALNSEADDATMSGVMAALGCRIRQHIESHLDDAQLGAEILAKRFNLSRASVYRLFVADGGVRRYIQQRRLERARLEVVAPRQHHRTIADIGKAAGYAHVQDFVRAFREQFGISPGAQRGEARHAAKARLGGNAAPRPEWVTWLRRLA
jgi:AraC-like DNA-binding protein